MFTTTPVVELHDASQPFDSAARVLKSALRLEWSIASAL